MDPKVKAFLIEKYKLAKDASDEDVQAYLDEHKIKVESLNIPEIPKVQDSAVKSNELFNKLDSVKDELNGKIDGLEERISTLNIQLKDNAENDPQLGYKNNLEFFLDVIAAGQPGAKAPERLVKAHQIRQESINRLRNAVGSDEAKVANNPDGGYLVPPAFMPGVKQTDSQAIQNDTGRLTMNIPMATQVININARVDKDHSTGSVSGGFKVYRRAETASVTASKGTFEQIEMKADALMGLAYASDEILRMSPVSFAALINAGFESERISKLNEERLRGTGAGEFMGVFNSPCKIEVAKESGQTNDTIVGNNILKMRQRCWGYNNAVWMANLDCYVQLAQAHIAGTNGDVFLFNPARGIDVPDMLLGRPVIFDENMSTLGDAGDLGLFNWSEYLEGQLGGPSFAESVHVRFEYNETAFKFNIYNAGAPWWRSPLTPKQSSQTLSPFVILAAR